MKKSKFMQSSKDMLSRSFNPSKCKTSLRLAGSRLKLLRNKKEVQVKQMRKEIAQLLESGQDQTARIRVEHVVREEKTMAAYDLIQIYSELIIARLPIIESQKNCPIDLKEAIASIIFASPRCGDVPELVDVKKQFTTKYGKDFATAAIEVRPACGVSRMLIEKLSATAPDGPTKVKILTGIAEEHNVVWDHKSFDEKDPPSDILSGPSTFGSENQPYVQPSRYAYQDVQATSDTTMHGSQSNSSYQDTKIPPETDNHALAQDLSSSKSFQGKERPPDRQQNWPMEFKDATSAAMAAAESAERASMAAKAAAEFANAGKFTRQYSTESRKSKIYVSRDEEEPESYLSAEKTTDRNSEKRMDRPFSDRTRLQKEQTDSINANRIKTNENIEEYGRGGKTVYSQSGSLKSKASVDEDFLGRGVPVVDGYSRKNSLKEDPRGEIYSKKQPFKHDPESRNEWPEKGENIREEQIRKQPSVKSYRSGSSISDEANIFTNTESPMFGYDTDNDSAVKGDVHEEDLLATVRFDKFDSDGDDHHGGFDIGPRYDEPSQKSTRHPSINRDSWGVGSGSTVKPYSSPLFAENLKSVNDFEQDTLKPVTFDDSDGPVSDIEETNMSKGSGIRNSSDLLSEHNRRYSGFHKKHLSGSSDEESMYMGKSQGNKSYSDSPKKFSLKKSSADLVEPNDYSEVSDSASGEELKLGALRGGFRQRGYNHLPYLKNQLNGSSSPKEEIDSNTIRPIVRSSVESPKISKVVDHRNRITPPSTESDSDGDSSEQEVPLQKSSITKPNIQKRRSGIEIKPKLSVGSSNSILGSNDSDLDDDKERFSMNNYSRGGFSRRTTKASPKSPEKASSNKTSSSKEDGSKRAGHVHPKLPDYDFLVQSLRNHS